MVCLPNTDIYLLEEEKYPVRSAYRLGCWIIMIRTCHDLQSASLLVCLAYP